MDKKNTGVRMRDAVISGIYDRMKTNAKIVFLSADFGAPALDLVRRDFPDRFINVGIAEQNLINISAGFAFENFIVFSYAIAPFLTMRAFESIRNNVSVLGQLKKLNINLLGVGAGLSYDVSGPTHHCLEDISIMRLLPNIMTFSPSDSILAAKLTEFAINNKTPKYIRMDGKPLKNIYAANDNVDILRGFFELIKGEDICLVSTGYMTHTALKTAEKSDAKIGVVDLFLLNGLDSCALADTLKNYKAVITLEEGFINAGGLDSLINNIVLENNLKIEIRNLGFKDKYVFDIGGRDYLHKKYGLDADSIIKILNGVL
ncbi:MAG TPA: transketolase C-terminal domain-containing protein [bacterium]|nr:transketolase C-terminal domain-containing protein [bacterium]